MLGLLRYILYSLNLKDFEQLTKSSGSLNEFFITETSKGLLNTYSKYLYFLPEIESNKIFTTSLSKNFSYQHC